MARHSRQASRGSRTTGRRRSAATTIASRASRGTPRRSSTSWNASPNAAYGGQREAHAPRPWVTEGLSLPVSVFGSAFDQCEKSLVSNDPVGTVFQSVVSASGTSIAVVNS
jgi:hypothetical protein